jgi:hypothetical protein
MTDILTMTASVETFTPERYAKQLAAHLGRRNAVRKDPHGTRVVLTGGECLLSPHDQVLDLHAQASTQAELDQVTQLVGSHLERFGQRNGLTVTWHQG